MPFLEPEDCTLVFGPRAYCLPHIITAVDHVTGTVDETRIIEPAGVPSFTLTIRHIPYSTEALTPGTSYLRIFTVNIEKFSYQFVTGLWEYTLDDHAILRCYAYRCSPRYERGTLGLLRIPCDHVRLDPNQVAPPTLNAVTPSLLSLWKTVHPAHHLYGELEFTFPYMNQIRAGAWDLIPLSTALDACASDSEKMERWKYVRTMLNEMRLEAEDEWQRI
ncbi:uncharacterized protein STEHIDRAFT_160757 [Stereum hirsutum FP-91666 SS1]|uniref:uncharacterized protein n=1 Tax=Stereum hirsutum (strain FP-91666) TaxID=721885 RepID=UPI0004449A66|nr:uncharacterized protein STEHIDRAFT_160757 [Stereum hirsutum FP-91666 SS1]EIM83158.1 hypothetical protein STEHIDRAFT_160757 [Stereum hirsutum FP-91666 SS1]